MSLGFHQSRMPLISCDINDQSGDLSYRTKAVRKTQAPVVKMKSTLLQAFTCTYCEQYFSSLGAQKRHVMRHKSKYLRWIKAKKKSSLLIRSVLAPFQCAVCNASFRKISSLENHIKVDHILVAAYGCNLCPFASFQDRDSYVDHVVDHVKSTFQLKAAYQCVYCKQCFVNNTVLGKHLKAKHEEMNLLLAMQYNLKIYQCGYCKQCFADTFKLRQHILNIHKIDKPFCCKFCRQCFTDFPSLSGHAQSMHTANPYHCEDCYLRFPDFSALAHHVDLVHRRDMYFCQVCKHGFAEYSTLARHVEQTHKHSQTETPNVPLAPYRCQICRRTHYNVTDLLIHARVSHGHTWADLAQDLAEYIQKPVRFQDERERENIACPRKISESDQMIRLARSTSVTTNDRTAEPETCSLGMVSNANNVMDPAKTEEESLSDLSYGASSEEIRPRQCEPPGKVGDSALKKNTGMSRSQGNMSSPNLYIPSLYKGQLVRPLSPYVRFMHNVLLKRRADYVNLKPWQVDKIIRDLWNKLSESDAEKARLKWEYKVNQTVYINAVKKRIERGKVHDHTYTRPPLSHLTVTLQVEQKEEKEIVDVVTVTEETQPQSRILSKLMTTTSPQQMHLKMLVGSQNGTVVPTKIAISSMQPVVSLVNMKSLFLGAFCKPKIKLLLLDAEGKPRKHQPYLEEYSKQCRLSEHNVYERKRREQERLSYLALGKHIPAITSKERVARIDILKHSTEYIHTLRNEEEKLVRVKDMERQRHEQLQEQLRNLQNGNVVHQCSIVVPAKAL